MVGILGNNPFCRIIELDKFYAVLPSLNCSYNPGYYEVFWEPRKSKLDFQPFGYRELGWYKSGHAPVLMFRA
jgi:hypothetical protein